MSTFALRFEVGDQAGTRFVPIEAMVDAGASYTCVPSDVLATLGVAPDEQREFILADGRHVTCGMAWMRVRLEGRERPTPVVFGEPSSDALLGAVTLEEFGLGVDALVPTPAYLVGRRPAPRQ